MPTSGTKDATNRFLNRNFCACVYLNGNFYVYGGSDSSGTPTTVYMSSDKGKNWTLLSASYSSQGRSGSGFAVYGGKMWLAGGAYDKLLVGFTVRNDLLSSADGISWTEVLPDGNAFFSQRNGLTLTVFKNKLYVIGGGTDAGASSSQQDVWQVQ